MMSTISRVCDSEIGGWRVSVETVPDIEWMDIPDALRAERAEIERVSGFILQKLESVVSSERMITIIPSICALSPAPIPAFVGTPIPRSVRSKVVTKKKRKRPMIWKIEENPNGEAQSDSIQMAMKKVISFIFIPFRCRRR